MRAFLCYNQDMSIFKSESLNKKPEQKINYAEILLKEAGKYTIKEANFSDVYDKDDIQKDITWCESQRQQQLEQAKREAALNNRIFTGDIGIRDALVQEYLTAREIVASDWFHEMDRDDELDPNGEAAAIETFLTSETDDRKNHIDIIATINNELTNYQPLPFAMDTTYNTSPAGLDKKMRWRHNTTKTPGAATAKYFMPDPNYDTSPYPAKGRIAIMPRFVIGFNPELADELSHNPINKEELSAKMKYCVLGELKNQTEQMLKYYEDHHDTPELQKLQEQVQTLDRYFGSALSVANKKNRFDWSSYPQKDPVHNAIISRNVML